MPALGGRVLDHEVLPGRGGGAVAHSALDELDEPPDAVLLVHDVVAGAQRERVDHVSPPRRHLAHVPGRRPGPARQVGLREDRQVQRGRDEARADRRRGDQHHAARGLGPDLGDQARRDVGRAELFAHAARGARSLGGQHEPPAVPLQAAHVSNRPFDVAAVARHVAGRDRQGRLRGAREPGRRPGLGVQAERTERPPAQATARRDLAGLGERGERRRTQVDRHTGARGGRGPGGGEELLGRGHQVVRPASHPLGIRDHQQRVVGHEVQHGDHRAGKDRREGLHALHDDALRQAPEHLDRARVPLHERGGPRPNLVGEQDLTARRRPHAALGDLEAALVGDREPPHLLDLVAPELHPQRVVLDGREHVEDPAAHGELPAALDHVHPGVRGGCEAVGEDGQVRPVADVELDRRELTETGDHRLQQRTDRQDQHADRPGLTAARDRVRKPAEDGQAARDGVGARGEPLVGERLPRGQHRHIVRREVATQRAGEIVGVSARRGHHDERASRTWDRPELPGARHGREQRCPHPQRPDHVDRTARGNEPDRLGGGRVGEHGGQQSGEVHAR